MHFLARRSKRLEKHGITSKDWMKSITWHDFTLDTRNPVNWVGLNDDRMVTFICPIEHYRAVEISWQNCQVQKLLSLEKSVCFRLSWTHKDHRQTVQYINPSDWQHLAQVGRCHLHLPNLSLPFSRLFLHETPIYQMFFFALTSGCFTCKWRIETYDRWNDITID